MKNRLLKLFTEVLRHHISLLLAITLLDIVLLLMNESVTVCFSLLLPQFIVAWGGTYVLLAEVLMIPTHPLMVITILLTAICFALFILSLVFSYRRPGWLICAAVMVLLDSGLVIYNLIATQDTTYYVDLITHGWAVIALILAFVLSRIQYKQRLTAETLEAIEQLLDAISKLPPEMPADESVTAEAAAELITPTAPEQITAPEGDPV